MTSNSRPDPAHSPQRAQDLAAAAASAAEIRALALDPDVIALRVERIRAQVDSCAWVAIGLGLAFTAVNVQQFAAAGAPVWSPGWLVAWLLDPMVSLLLIAVLRAEQVTARWQVPTGVRVTAAKWGCFAATYAMNTWASWTSGVPSGVVLHSVPPLVVLLGAEVAPELRDRLTAAVRAAAQDGRGDDGGPGAGPVSGLSLPGEAASTAVDPGQDRVAALAVPPTAGPRPGHDPDPGPAPPELELELEGLSSGPGHPDVEPEPEPESELEPGGFDGGVQYRRHDVGTDPRVGVLAELLAAGEPVTGAQAAALHQVSDRQGRRLLQEAREQTTTAAAVAGSTGRPTRRGLRVVPDESTPSTTSPTTTAATTTAVAPGGEYR